jgi:hypothetical protein
MLIVKGPLKGSFLGTWFGKSEALPGRVTRGSSPPCAVKQAHYTFSHQDLLQRHLLI